MTAPRRRADDWKRTSDVGLNRRWMDEMLTRLGYNPGDVNSIRMNPREIIVTSFVHGSVRHPMFEDGAQ